MSDILQRELRPYKAYILRLPILTRSVGTICIGIYFLQAMGFELSKWLNLDPGKINLGTMYRLNTYPLVHLGFFHLFFNLIALTPLLERYEKEHGTLLTLLQILGPVTTFPAFLYLALEMGLLRSNTAVEGASAWVFTFLAAESIKTYNIQPYFELMGKKIPTWATPLFSMLLIAFLMPGTSFLGHLCGVLIGYAMGKGYLNILLTPEWILRKVEDKLPLDAMVPHYVGLEAREKPSFKFILPSHAQDTEMGDFEGSSRGEGAFRGVGRPLGS